MKTLMTPAVTVETHFLDASGIPLGRLATRAADLLRGKHKPSFVNHLDVGDQVTIIHAAKVVLTGRKAEQKVYYHHTGYLGHLKEQRVKDLLERRPEEVVQRAIAGMLPRNRLKAHWLKRLVIWSGEQGETHGR